MNVQRALSGRLLDACTSQAADLSHGRAKSPKSFALSARAVRPSAASARPQQFVAGSSLCAEPSFGIEEETWLLGHSWLEQPKSAMFVHVTACSQSMQALRSSAKPNTGRAATSSARGGGFGLFARGATQRTMHAGGVPQSAMRDFNEQVQHS